MSVKTVPNIPRGVAVCLVTTAIVITVILCLDSRHIITRITKHQGTKQLTLELFIEQTDIIVQLTN